MEYKRIEKPSKGAPCWRADISTVGMDFILFRIKNCDDKGIGELWDTICSYDDEQEVSFVTKDKANITDAVEQEMKERFRAMFQDMLYKKEVQIAKLLHHADNYRAIINSAPFRASRINALLED